MVPGVGALPSLSALTSTLTLHSSSLGWGLPVGFFMVAKEMGQLIASLGWAIPKAWAAPGCLQNTNTLGEKRG